jgi:hypothetical protein
MSFEPLRRIGLGTIAGTSGGGFLGFLLGAVPLLPDVIRYGCACGLYFDLMMIRGIRWAMAGSAVGLLAGIGLSLVWRDIRRKSPRHAA